MPYTCLRMFLLDLRARIGWHLARLIQQLLSAQNARGGVLYNRLNLSRADASLSKALFWRNHTDLYRDTAAQPLF